MTVGDIFQHYRGRPAEDREEFLQQYPFIPLNSPGMPMPGDSFLRLAEQLGDPPIVTEGRSASSRRLVSYGPNLEYLHHRALYDENFQMQVVLKNHVYNASFVVGHMLGDDVRNFGGGPQPANVMILGKMPGPKEVQFRRNMVGPASEILLRALRSANMENMDDIYVTNLVPWGQLDPNTSTLSVAQKKEAAVLLWQTLMIVQPQYLLCLGSDASKFLLGTGSGVNAMGGRVKDLEVPLPNAPGGVPQSHTVKVMACQHPATVLRSPDQESEFVSQVQQFVDLTRGQTVGGRELDIEHVNIYTERHLKRVVDSILNDPDPGCRIIAVDGEWEGNHPENENAYLRTVQFSARHKQGFCVVLRHQGGDVAFKPGIDRAIYHLKRLLKYDPDRNYYPQIGGHFFRSDIPWLLHEGLDLRDEYAPPDTPEECRNSGGWDTGLMHHAYNETASFRLTDLTIRLTEAPVYDEHLKKYIADYCKLHDIKPKDLEGYGFLPDWILHAEPDDPSGVHNYSAYDSDITRRIAIQHMEEGGLLDRDWNGNNCWSPYWRSHRASLGVLEMEMTGLLVDKDRVDEVTQSFITGYDRLLQDFQTKINWPSFNPNSPQQCVAILYGDAYSKKVDKTTGETLPILPDGVESLGLTPIKSTGKGQDWAQIVAEGTESQNSPSTSKEVLGIHGHTNALAMQLRDIKFLAQILKSTLRRPELGADNLPIRDDDGNKVYKKGLAGAAQDDGRVHTRITQCLETGRAASSGPNLMAISKRREADYKRILGTRTISDIGDYAVSGGYTELFVDPLYVSPVRTIFQAPEGYVFVEADYTGAELAILAWLCGDPTMIDHVRRNALPEDHPDFYDMHSARAVQAFRLGCPPTKAGLKSIGMSHMRTPAKAVAFGEQIYS